MSFDSEKLSERLLSKIRSCDSDQDAINILSVSLRQLYFQHFWDIKIDNCAYKYEWDVYGHLNIENENYLGNKEEWNQTLISKVNQVSAQIHKSTLRGGANIIKSNPRNYKLFESLHYYVDGMLGSRYTVEFSSNIPPNEIFVFYDKVFNTELYPETDIKSDTMGEISFKMIGNLNDAEIIEYKKGFCGCITLLHGESFLEEPIINKKFRV